MPRVSATNMRKGGLGPNHYSPKSKKRVKRIHPMPLEGLVVIEQILLHYPVGKTTLYKEIKEGIFPAQRVRRGRSVFWDAAEVRFFLKSIGANIEISDSGAEEENEA